MKKAILSALLAFVVFTAPVEAANPTCVFMKFTDDTRFVKVDSAPSLSDLVMEKLLASGQFNFKETKVIDADMENLLYEERAAEFKNARSAVNSGNYNVLFEGPGFNEEKAQTIATAQVGQIISPQITSAIGKQHGADYLIQGTIRNIGTGNWMDMDSAQAVNLAQNLTSYMSSTAAGLAGTILAPLGALASAVSVNVTGIAVQADLKLIQASTGEVIWQKMVTGKKTQRQYKIGGLAKIGSDKLSNELYSEAMDNAAEVIANALIEDIGSGKVFGGNNE